MKSILLKLYDGEVFPTEQYTPKTEAYQKKRHEHYTHYTDFVNQLKLLDPPLDRKFADIIDEQLEIFTTEMSEMFFGGFRLGARMMIEVFQNDYSDKTE